MNIENNNLVTLDNNKSYVILDQVNIDDSVYCFITELIANDAFMIVQKEIENSDVYFKLITDNIIEDKLKAVFAKRLGIEI